MKGLLFLLGMVLAEHPIAADVPAYPRAPLVRIGGTLVIDGQRHALGYFVTAEEVDAVARHFVSLWRGEGLVVLTEDSPSGDRLVSGFATRAGVQRLVVLRRVGARTVAFSAVRELFAVEEKGEAPAESSPLEVKSVWSEVTDVEAALEGVVAMLRQGKGTEVAK